MRKALPSIIGYKYASNWVWRGCDTYNVTMWFNKYSSSALRSYSSMIIWFCYQLLSIYMNKINWESNDTVQLISLSSFLCALTAHRMIDSILFGLNMKNRNHFDWTGKHVRWRLYGKVGCAFTFTFIVLLQLDSTFYIRRQIQFICVSNCDHVLTWLIYHKIQASNILF